MVRRHCPLTFRDARYASQISPPMKFDDYFSEEAIIRELCRARIKLAAKRHDAQFFHNINRKTPSAANLRANDWGGIPQNIFPPRRTWHRYRPRNRGRGASALQVETLFRATTAQLQLVPTAVWARNLKRVLTTLRNRALAQAHFTFKEPKIILVPKDATSQIYRPLTVYALPDKIIESLTARYLRVELDHVLLPACMAFRARRHGRRPPTTHDALQRIEQARNRYTQLYVAECDIQGFFDCVSHKVAREALARLVAEARARDSTLNIDGRALDIFTAYLNSYSFVRSIRNGGAMRQLQRREPKALCKWPAKELAILHQKRPLHRVGVPQGGALSCFIANAVLHKADQALAALPRTTARFTYLRYCDDMIILAPTKKACDEAFRTYLEAVNDLRLPVHEPKVISGYDAAYYDGKSNLPYLWRKPTRPRHVPWIQFVGYQIRHDGLVRVRRKSVTKHKERITDATNRLLSVLRLGVLHGGLRRSARQIRFRFQQKLISMSVGRATIHSSRRPMPLCWAAGFRGLTGRSFVRGALRDLDRHRERQLRRIERRLDQLQLPQRGSGSRVTTLGYYGSPFSYNAQFR